MNKERIKQNNAKQHRTKNPRRSTDPKLPRNTIVGRPNPDVANIPCNETGTFIEKLFVKCSFCTQKFDRPDEYYLHHAEKHAKLYRTLPKPPNDDASAEYVNNKEGTETNSTLDAVINTSNRKRSCTPNVYNNDETDTSSSDYAGNDDESPENSIAPADAVNLVEIPNANSSTEVAEPRRKSKRQSSKSKQTDDESSSSSDSDDSSSEPDADIQNMMKMFVKTLSKTVIKHYKNKIVKRNKKQTKILYKCNTCCLHFLKEDEWRKHLKRGNHSDTEQTQCDRCTRKFDQNSLRKHMKMHTINGTLNKAIKFYIITETGSGSEENSDSDDEEQTSVANSKKTSKTSMEEPSKSDKEQEKLGKQNENKIDQVEYGIPQAEHRRVQVNSRQGKRILYKCDDCEEHFLSKENVEKHTKNKTHHRMQKNTTCEYCTYKFSSTSTLKTHLRLHQEHNLTKDDFKVILWTKFGRRVHEKRRVMNPKPKNSSFPRQHSNQINKRGCRTYDETLIYRCEGCDVHFLKYTTWISHTHNCNNVSKEKCLKCERYFSKKIIMHHEEIHRRRPNLKRDDFKIKSRKPVLKQNNCVPQSNIVSTTEDNVDNPIIVQGTAGADEAENDPCKLKLSKTTDNTWIVSNNKKCGEKSTNGNDNESVDNMNADERSTIEENSSEDVGTDGTGQATVENDTDVQSTDNSNSLSAVIENINNIGSTNNLTENDKETRLDENVMVIVQSTFFDISQNETQSEADRDVSTAVASTAIQQLSNNNESTNAPNNNTDRNENQQIKDEISDEIKAEPCSSTELSIKNEIINEKIRLENDKPAPETQIDSNHIVNIKIAECYSTRLKFEDSDTQKYGFEAPTSTQNKVEMNVENVDLSNVKVNYIKPETLQSSHVHSDQNIKYINTTVQQKIYRDRNNIDCYDDDSQATLLLVPDDEGELPADENFRDQVNNIESHNKENISTYCRVSDIDDTQDRDSITPVGTSNETLHENNSNNNDHAIENQASRSKSVLSNRRKTTEYDIEQISLDFDRSCFRVRNRSECRDREDLQNKNDAPEVGIKKESKQENRKGNRKYQSCELDNNQEIISLDSDDDDDAVVEIPNGVDLIDLSDY